MDRDTILTYAERMAKIRELSSPQIGELKNAEKYSEKLRDNFEEIGRIAGDNKDILQREIFPILESEDYLTEEMIEAIRELSYRLVNADDLENLDVPVMSLLSERLIKDAEKKMDHEYIVQQLDKQIIAAYSLMYMTSRIFTNLSISEGFRDKGVSAAKDIMAYLDPAKFASLSDESKELVLTDSRYSRCLYERASGTNEETAKQWLNELRFSMKIYEDPLYHELYPDFDWDYYLFRALEHHGNILDHYYEGNIDTKLINEIEKKLAWQERLWLSDPDIFGKFAPLEFVRINLYRARYLSKKLDLEEYRKLLLEIYEKRDPLAYDYDSVYINLKIPADYILSCWDVKDLTEEDVARISRFYTDILSYAFHMPNGATLTALLEFFSEILFNFLEIPGGLTFRDMCLRSMAAFHPPTYVHSCSVASLTRCITKHLLSKAPEYFIGTFGCENTDDVAKNFMKIYEFSYESALCHDFGKLPLIDTIFIYGRNLLDFEIEIIQQHPMLGAKMMEKFDSTKAYAPIAAGHHKFYDGSGGYPDNYNPEESGVKTIIDIVTVADCLDAATDTVGRSYSKGKVFDEVYKELKEGSGTRYAPYIVDLLGIPEVSEDVKTVLSRGRSRNYRNTYMLLREVHER